MADRTLTDREYWNLDGPLTQEQAEFFAALRERAGSELQPWVARVDTETFFVAVDIDAPDVALITAGAYVAQGRLRGDSVDLQDYSLPTEHTEIALDVTAPPRVLADRLADWFEELAARRIVRHEWHYRDRMYASCYLFEDSGWRLSQMYRRDWAPPGQADQLISDGFVFGKGWIQTSRLGPPDRVTVVSGLGA
jgi:hypothetical protein